LTRKGRRSEHQFAGAEKLLREDAAAQSDFARAPVMDFQILLERRPLGLPLREPGIARDSKDG